MAVVLVTTAVSLPVFMVGTMAVAIQHSMHFGSADLGIAIALYYLGAATLSMPASHLAERFGGGKVMRSVVLFSAIVLGLLGAVASSWIVLAVLLAVAGVMAGANFPAANVFLARRSADKHQGFAFGIKQAAVPLASLLGGLAVPSVALSLGWRAAFGLAVPIALVAAASIPRSSATGTEPRRTRGQSSSSTDHVVDKGPLVVLAVALGLGILASSGCAAFLVSAAVTVGFSKGAAGIIAAAAGLATVTVRIGTGVQADRRGSRHLPVVAGMLVCGTLGYALLATSMTVRSGLLLVVGAVVALGLGWGWNGLFTFAVVQSYPQAPAAATGVTQVGGRLGGVIGPVVVGFVVSHGTYTDAWLVACASEVCAAVAVLVARSMLVGGSRQPPTPALRTVGPPTPRVDP